MKIIAVHGEDTEKSYARIRKFIESAKARNWEVLYEINESGSLFGGDRLTILRDYKLFPKREFNGTVVIYHEATLPATFLKSLPKDAKIEEYKLSKLIWSFLNRPTLNLFHEVIKTEPVEFVFIMLFRTFKKQGKYDFISQLAKIDFDYKTGKADLVLSLDLFFLKNLQ